MQKSDSKVNYLLLVFGAFISLMVLTACAGFNGLRKPLYDGQPVEPKAEAIDVYEESGEVVGAEKEHYFRYPFSAAVYEPSLDYPDEAPILLEEGIYTVGEDLPAGRATLLGNESVFAAESYEVHVGNMVIRDAAGDVYFENLFHSLYGQATVQVDLIAGHEIEIIGTGPEVTVFYAKTLPEDPYRLMDPPELLVTMGRLEVQQPVAVLNKGEIINLTAGIYEVGVHLEAGTYEVTNVLAPHNSEMYLFREGEEPRVFELLMPELVYFMEPPTMDEAELAKLELASESGIEIELQVGDKIYPNLVSQLQLTRVEAE